MSSISAANAELHRQLVAAVDAGIERLRRLGDDGVEACDARGDDGAVIVWCPACPDLNPTHRSSSSPTGGRSPIQPERRDQAGDRRTGDGADRPGLPPAGDLGGLGDDRRGRRPGRAATTAGRFRSGRLRARSTESSWSPRSPTPTTASTTSSPTRCCGSSSTTCGICPTRRTSAATRPRRSSSATTPSTRTWRARCSTRSTRVEKPVVMVHDYHLYTLPGPHPPRAARCVPAPLRPHPVEPVGLLARAAEGHPQRDLRGDPVQRHHRVPHRLLPQQLPAVLPGPDGLRRRLRGGRGHGRGPRGVGAGLSAADRLRRRPGGRRAGPAWPSSRPSCCAGAGTT